MRSIIMATTLLASIAICKDRVPGNIKLAFSKNTTSKTIIEVFLSNNSKESIFLISPSCPDQIFNPQSKIVELTSVEPDKREYLYAYTPKFVELIPGKNEKFSIKVKSKIHNFKKWGITVKIAYLSSSDYESALQLRDEPLRQYIVEHQKIACCDE